MKCGICFTCWWGLVFREKLQSVDLNEYISIQDCIIVIILLIFYDLLDLPFLENCNLCSQSPQGTTTPASPCLCTPGRRTGISQPSSHGNVSSTRIIFRSSVDHSTMPGQRVLYTTSGNCSLLPMSTLISQELAVGLWFSAWERPTMNAARQWPKTHCQQNKGLH